MTGANGRGKVLIPLAALLLGVLALGLSMGSAQHPTVEIVLQIRLPRVLLAAVVGAGLATAGAI